MTRQPGEKRWIEQAALAAVDGYATARDPSETAEARAFAEAFARIGLAAAAAPPASLRERVLATPDGSRTPASAGEIRPGVTLLRAADSKWRDFPFPGVRYRALRRAEDGELRTLLIEMDPGSRYPDHAHDRLEEILVLRGSLDNSGQVLREGDYCRSLPGTADHDVFSPEGALFLVTLVDLQPRTL